MTTIMWRTKQLGIHLIRNAGARDALLHLAWILAAALVTVGIAGLVPLAPLAKVLVFALLTGAVLRVFYNTRAQTPR